MPSRSKLAAAAFLLVAVNFIYVHIDIYFVLSQSANAEVSASGQRCFLMAQVQHVSESASSFYTTDNFTFRGSTVAYVCILARS
jgi:hypothetical protein